MSELNVNEIEQISGGILPLVVAIVMADLGLIGAMKGAGYW
jgi:lactobin A/cerein 7B family class IIb bacteriocin